ncbi:MAG: hypothetical protein DRH11_06535 [Deltaproteobacteria bacterium]|nr:MAG: hypothetical protein DRH11_06535 [Deltaproteobacteria bacterium]
MKEKKGSGAHMIAVDKGARHPSRPTQPKARNQGGPAPALRSIAEFSHKGKSLPQILEAHRKWLRGEGGERADLRKANLIGADLGGVYLIGANLSGAIMIDARLSGSNLIGANLQKAKLIGADLSGSDLVAANLNGSILREANLSKANLSEASLLGAVLRDAILREANLNFALLEGALLDGAILIGGNLEGAKLFRSEMSKVNLVGARLAEADMREANLAGANLSGSDLKNAAIVEANMAGASLIGADLGKADMRQANLKGAILRDAVLNGSVLVNADLSGADLSGASLEGANLLGWVIKGVRCTHILKDKEIIRFSPGEFESRYAGKEKISEIVLAFPLSVAAVFVGQFLSQAINEEAGFEVMALKGVEAISNEQTKFTFSVFAEDYYEKEIKPRQAQLSASLDKYLADHRGSKDEIYLGDFLPGKNSGVVRMRQDRLVTYLPSRTNSRIFQEKMAEQYKRMEKIGNRIREAVTAVLK